MKMLVSVLAGLVLLATPAAAENYLIHGTTGGTECTWDEAVNVMGWPGVIIPDDATEVRMCAQDNDLAGALERMKANRGGSGGVYPIPPAPTPTDPEPTDPVDPDPVDPDPTDPGDDDCKPGHGHGDDDCHSGPPGHDDDEDDDDDHPDLDDIIDGIKDGICSRKPHLPFC